MNRRQFLAATASLAALPADWRLRAQTAGTPARRVRPGDPGWPSDAAWEDLGRKVGGRLIKLHSPFDVCTTDPNGAACRDVTASLGNPFFIGDDPALTQNSGWLDAWTSAPSAYAVAAASAADVAAGVAFARAHNLRLVVKGGGHSYQGTSCAPDSLLLWTRAMHEIALHDAFVPRGCDGRRAQPAVSVDAGAMWLNAYDAVTTKGGRYVQGGGCTTVGVAGLIQSGGFGSFSKRFGLAAAGLLEAEVVTADGAVRIANACTNPDLFWALKGGGGGSFGVVTRVTLRTRDLPASFGAVFGAIKAASDEAYRRAMARVMAFYRERLFNPNWGEQIRFDPDNTIGLQMVFQGLSQDEAEAIWRPFVEWVNASPKDFSWERPFVVAALPARSFWDPAFLKAHVPQVIVFDDRPDAPAGNFLWAGNRAEAGQFLHAYRSAWLPASLLDADDQRTLCDALFAASRHWTFSLHFNKGLAGAPDEDVAAARDTAINPAALDAFALAIVAAEGPPAFPGMPGQGPDRAAGRRHADAVNRATEALLAAAPNAGSYVSESDFFERRWQQAFWGANYARLRDVKRRYDPDGLFVVHHGVGSEDWSDDGFTRVR